MGIGHTNRTSGQSRGWDLYAYYQALLQFDLRAMFRKTREKDGSKGPAPTRDIFELISGGLHRSIPKNSIGRGQIASRKEQTPDVKLGPKNVAVHRPQGAHGKSGTIAFC